jgi:hypothetical protein
MTQEVYEYVTLGIWLTMVVVAAAAMWPRRSSKDRGASDTNPVQTQRAAAATQHMDDGS